MEKRAAGKDYYGGNTVDEFIYNMGLQFREGNVVKYVCRYRNKNGLEDLLKARDYLDRVIQSYKKELSSSDPPF